jgi:metallophosphoesterase superfamily enzyme
VPGNHDCKRGLAHLGGARIQPQWPVFSKGIRLGDWLVLHGDGTWPEQPVVVGHFHPSMYAAGKNWPCYLVGPRQIILPAYSQDARGGQSCWPGFRRFVAVGSEVLDFGCSNLSTFIRA